MRSTAEKRAGAAPSAGTPRYRGRSRARHRCTRTSAPGAQLLCADSAAELGGPEDWRGLAAGEPERFSAEYWDEQSELDPQWNINLEGLPKGLTPGSTLPGYVFYRETDEGLCVVDVAWSTLATEG